MERRFDSDNDFEQRYLSFMQECSKSYYLPYHGVIKEDSITTKLRVVFDNSSATTTEASFNDVMLEAPNINADLFDVLLRYRSYPVVFLADIENNIWKLFHR